MKKLVITNIGKASQGKTSSIKEVFAQLQKAGYPCDIIYEAISKYSDVMAIFTIEGVKVGIESQGDPKSRMPESMNYFVKSNCQIIVAACRTSGETYQKILELNSKYDYDIIWSPNDKTEISERHIQILNERYAKRVIQLIFDRISGLI